jgi:predicted ATPase
VLFVDDAHWADEPTAELLVYLARRLSGRPVLMILAWRADEIGPGHRFRQLARSATLVCPGRLGREAVGELARASGADADAERLFQETAGLPLFVVEYLAALAERDEEDWSLPNGIVELLRARLASVSETGRQVLGAGAVVGRAFDLATIRDVSGRSDDEAVVALEELTARGLLEEAADGYGFGHEQVRAVVYEDLSLARRRLLHRRAAELLSTRSRRDARTAGLVGEHFRLAGQEAEAAEWFEAAGDHARRLYANAEALAHYRTALALGHPDSAGLHEAIGDLLTLLGEYGAAIESYELAAAIAGPHLVPQLEHKLGGVHDRRGDFELAVDHFEAALDGLDDPGRRARVEADRSLTEHRRGRSTEAQLLAQRALELAEAAGDEHALAQAHNILGVLASSRGDLSEARSHLEQSLALAEQLGEQSAKVAALNNLGLNARAAGDVEGALALANRALELCASQGDRHREAALHNNLADLLHAAGHSEEAMAELKQAVAIFAEVGAEAGEAQPEIWKLVEW